MPPGHRDEPALDIPDTQGPVPRAGDHATVLVAHENARQATGLEWVPEQGVAQADVSSRTPS